MQRPLLFTSPFWQVHVHVLFCPPRFVDTCGHENCSNVVCEQLLFKKIVPSHRPTKVFDEAFEAITWNIMNGVLYEHELKY